MTQYGKFKDFCRDAGNRHPVIPVCNIFLYADDSRQRGFANGCVLEGIPLSNGRHLANLGSILLDGIAIVIALLLFFLTNRKRAAVGRREMQLFLFGYIVISISEIFSVGGFPLENRVRLIFSAINIAAVTATTWILLMNGAVGFQLLDDGTFLSLILILGSAAALFVGTGYIALDTSFSWTGYWNSTLDPATGDQAYALYTLFFLAPLVFIVVYFILEAVLVLRVLREKRPMLYLFGAGLLFAIGQVFQFVISQHICAGTKGKINGGLFEVLFTLLAVIFIWLFWSSITEDDWPVPVTAGGAPTYT